MYSWAQLSHRPAGIQVLIYFIFNRNGENGESVLRGTNDSCSFHRHTFTVLTTLRDKHATTFHSNPMCDTWLHLLPYYILTLFLLPHFYFCFSCLSLSIQLCQTLSVLVHVRVVICLTHGHLKRKLLIHSYILAWAWRKPELWISNNIYIYKVITSKDYGKCGLKC